MPQQLITRRGFLLPGEDVSEVHAKLVRAYADAAEATLSKHDAAVARIQGDPGLNGKGKADRIARERGKARDEIATLAAPIDRQLSTAQGMAKEAIPTKIERPRLTRAAAVSDFDTLRNSVNDGFSRLQDQQRDAELRQHFAGISDPALRRAEVHSAAAAGDTDSMVALDTAPAVLRRKIIGDDNFAKARESYLRTAHAPAYEKLDEVNRAVNLHVHNTQAVAKEIGGASDPIKVAAQNVDQ